MSHLFYLGNNSSWFVCSCCWFGLYIKTLYTVPKPFSLMSHPEKLKRMHPHTKPAPTFVSIFSFSFWNYSFVSQKLFNLVCFSWSLDSRTLQRNLITSGTVRTSPFLPCFTHLSSGRTDEPVQTRVRTRIWPTCCCFWVRTQEQQQGGGGYCHCCAAGYETEALQDNRTRTDWSPNLFPAAEPLHWYLQRWKNRVKTGRTESLLSVYCRIYTIYRWLTKTCFIWSLK